ncbi:MAG: TonB-dependent receptor [Rikenellaceae bacterium]
MRVKITLFIMLLFGVVAGAYAAPRPITGVVTDKATNESVIGVTVIINGTTVGTVTDWEGRYTINVESGQELIFSYLGYDTQTIAISDAITEVNVLMAEDSETIEEILVVGYGVQKKNSAVGSIAQVKGDEILKAGSVSTVSQAIQGTMPGVVITQDSTKPGAESSTIYIRGTASWQDSSPLCLVDGVERSFDDIDPNEIESLSVLKDASATAVYGVKGANGVILITTKRGTNDRPKVNFSANFGVKTPIFTTERSDYVTAMQMWNEACMNDQSWSSMIPTSTIEAWSNAYETGNYGAYNDDFPEINWFDEMIDKVGFQQQYNVNISGGTDFVRYFASIGYLNDGDILNTVTTDDYDGSYYYKRYNWRTNLDFSVTPTTTVSVNLSGKYGHRNQSGYRIDGTTETGYGDSEFYQSLYTSATNLFPITWDDGEYGVMSDGTGNMYRNFDRGSRMYKYYQHFIDVAFKQKLDMITQGLSVNAKFAYTVSTNTDSYVQKYQGDAFGTLETAYSYDYDYSTTNSTGGYIVDGSGVRWTDSVFQGDRMSASYDNMLSGGYAKKLYYEFAINYARTFGDHDVTGLILMNRNENSGLTNSSTTALEFVEKDEAWVTRATYGYKGRYLAEFNGAYTGSQKFAPGMRFAFFPSYSLGWRISEEPFIKNNIGDKLNNLKVRYSYGQVGYDRSATAYSYIQTYSNDGGNAAFGYDTKSTYGDLYSEGALANTNATWETAVKQNLGIEFKIFNKFSGSLDIFKEDRTGILMDVSNPIWVGVSSSTANLGITKSHGLEAEIEWRDNIGDNFRYWIKANYAINENRVVYRNDAEGALDYTKYEGKSINYQSRYYTNGYYTSLDDIYNYTTTNNTTVQATLVPGDLIYLDYNGDGVIDEEGDKIPVDYNTYPQKTYGGSIGFGYKGFEFNALIYGVYDIYKGLNSYFAFDNQRGGSGVYYANADVIYRWTYDTASAGTAVKPSLHTALNDDYSQDASTYLYQNASYVSLQSVELSYRFTTPLFKRVGISSFQLYVSGNNLCKITPFSSQTDPTLNSISSYPLVRRYNIGVRFSF